MILKIRSKNNNLLDLLHKNPNTDFGLYAKRLRNGQVIGNVVSKNEYEVIFQDTKYSYLPEESNQIDFQSFASPLVVLHICNALFTPILKDKNEYWTTEITWLEKNKAEIDTLPCEIEVKNFYINSNWFRDGKFLLSKYFQGIELTPIVGYNYNLTIKGENLFQAMNLLNLVAVLTHVTNRYGEFTFIDDQFAAKYSRILTNVDNVPYFVFYLFIKRAVKSERQFNDLKSIFEEYLKNQNIEAKLTFYSTQQDRVHFILSQIDRKIPILDVGSGEFEYYRRIMKKGFSHPYYAVDIDPIIEAFSHIMKRRYKEDNLVFLKDINLFQSDETVDIIATEVIEHNSLEEAHMLLKKLLQLNFRQIIITTPDKDFNQYYFDEVDDATRHDDHEFELTNHEFRDFINNITGDNYELSFHGIGDELNGSFPTQAAIIKPKL